MRFTKQIGNDDCLAASIASLLDLPLAVVPVFPRAKDGDAQLRCCQKWLAKLGWTLLEIPIRSKRNIWREMAIPTPCILGVKSVTGSHDHAVVGRIDKNGIHALHDPDRAELIQYKLISVMLLVPAIPPGTALENLRLLRE